MFGRHFPKLHASLFVFLFTVANPSWVLANSHHGIKFNLIHRNHVEGNHDNMGQLSQFQRLIQLADGDTARLEAISRKVRLHNNGGRRRAQETRAPRPECSGNGGKNDTDNNRHRSASGELPMNSAVDYGTGQYFVQFQVGSPPQKFVLIADTGSDLTWMNCNYRCRGRRCANSAGKQPIFHAGSSSSFRTIPCSSHLCKIDLAPLFSLTRCPAPLYPCSYDYRYADGSAALGLFANETVTFSLTDGTKSTLHNVLIGCTQTTRGQSFVAADGVMGLGYSNYSLAVKAANQFGGKFSYCLVDHLSPQNISSYLIFGSHIDQPSIPVYKMRYTALTLGAIPPFYTVNLKGISIGGSMLNIPSETWNLNGAGGVILDSGSSLTALTQPAYRPVMAALKLSLRKFRRLDRINVGPFEFCFNSTAGFDETDVPRLVFHFQDGARFEPPVKNYVIDADPDAGVKCLGFVAAEWPGASVIGNIMQQNHFWEFDIAMGRLGFAPSSCT